MFLIAVTTVLILAFALTALVLVLVARAIVGAWLRYSSAFKAVAAAYVVTTIAFLFVAYVGDLRLTRILAADSSTVAIVLLQMLLLALATSLFCKIPDGHRVGLRSAFIVSIATTLITTAAGWLTFMPAFSTFLPSGAGESRLSKEASQTSVGSKLCLRNLSMVLSDTGRGPNAQEARAYRERLEQEAQAKGIGLEQALKTELSKLGTQLPVGCEHFN